MFRTTLLLLLLFAAQPFAHSANAAERATVPNSCGCRHCENSNCVARGEWFVVETANFSVWSRTSKHHAVETAEKCEPLRSRLQSNWNLDADGRWQPKCAVVVHAGIEAYRLELGNLDRSVGCTTITCDGGRIVFRRIDLRADASDWQSNALPHELTHVVLADRFGDRPLPHWLNEGLAMLAENEELRDRRETVLTTAHLRGHVPALQTVLAARSGLPHDDADLGYAVSASLVRDLEQHLGRDSLLDFAERLALEQASVPSTRTLALVGGLEKWERRWRDSIARVEPAPLLTQ
jgi:hypothetical protein